MGLSNEERMIGIYHAVSKLSNMTVTQHERLVQLLDSLWGVIMASHSNGLYWFCGDSSGQSEVNPTSLWGWATNCAISRLLDEPGFIESKEREGTSRDADWFKHRCHARAALEPENLQAVTECYKWVEHYFYYANRYVDDSLAKSMTELSKTMSTIAGVCADIMKDNRDVAVYWLFSRVIEYSVEPFEVYFKETTKDPVARLWIDLGLERKCALSKLFTVFEDPKPWFRQVTARVKALRDTHGRGRVHRAKISPRDRFELTMLAVRPEAWMTPHDIDRTVQIVTRASSGKRSKNGIDITAWADTVLPLVKKREEEKKAEEADRARSPEPCWILDLYNPVGDATNPG